MRNPEADSPYAAICLSLRGYVSHVAMRWDEANVMRIEYAQATLLSETLLNLPQPWQVVKID